MRLQSADKLIVNKADNGRVIVIEYEIHGRSSRRVPSMKIGSARSSNFESARSRIGEIGLARGVERSDRKRSLIMRAV
jgi:hypothetical protein